MAHPELLVYVSFEKMMTSLETVAFQRGDVVFAEGEDVEESPYMYILGSGKVNILSVGWFVSLL